MSVWKRSDFLWCIVDTKTGEFLGYTTRQGTTYVYKRRSFAAKRLDRAQASDPEKFKDCQVLPLDAFDVVKG